MGIDDGDLDRLEGSAMRLAQSLRGEVVDEKPEPSLRFTPPTFVCPIHGEQRESFNSSIKGFEGDWCLVCFVQWVDRNIPRMMKK